MLGVQGLEGVLDLGLVVGWLRGEERAEIGDEGGDGLVEVLVAIGLEEGVVGAFGERPEDDAGAGVDEDDAELPDGFAAVVAGDGLAEVDLVVKLEDEVGLGWIVDELAVAELADAEVEVVVGAEAVGVFLVAGVAEEDFAGAGDGCGERGRGRVLGLGACVWGGEEQDEARKRDDDCGGAADVVARGIR